MDKLLEWLVANSSHLPMIGYAVAALILILIGFVFVGFIQGREISFWPPRVGPQPAVPNSTEMKCLESYPSLGLSDWKINSREVADRAHWEKSARLTIGVMYSPKFFKDFYDVLEIRCKASLATTVLIIDPHSKAASFLIDSVTSSAKVSENIGEIYQLLVEADAGTGYIQIRQHDRVLRYSFIHTEDSVWIKFFTNSPNRAIVPALKFSCGTSFFDFFDQDIDRLRDQSRAG